MWFGYRFEKDDGAKTATDKLAALKNAPQAVRYWNKPGEPEVKTSDIGFAAPPSDGRPKVFVAEDRTAHEIKSVPLHKMVAQQPTVVRSKVLEKIAKPVGGPPIVHAAPDGKYYVEDGHHRIAAAMLRGRKTITAVVHRWQPSGTGLMQTGALPGVGGS